MDGKERARRFLMARTVLNQHGEETKNKVYEITGVPASALVDYENPDSSRALNLKNVQKLADHYGLNAAWLLGQSDSWSLEGDIRQVSDMTGLSPEAIWALQDLMKDEGRKKFINSLLASEEFSRMVYALSGMKNLKDSERSNAVDYISALNGFGGGDQIGLCERDVADLRLWKASRAMEEIMRKLTIG